MDGWMDGCVGEGEERNEGGEREEADFMGLHYPAQQQTR